MGDVLTSAPADIAGDTTLAAAARHLLDELDLTWAELAARAAGGRLAPREAAVWVALRPLPPGRV